MGTIELVLREYYAGLGHNGYSLRLFNEGMINMRPSKGFIDSPKPEGLNVTIDLNEVEKDRIENEQISEYLLKGESKKIEGGN